MTREEKIAELINIRDNFNYTLAPREVFDDAIKALEQEPKTGHWEYGYAFADGNYCKCSECKEIIKCTYPMHYCPNCGARMAESEK